MQLLEPILGKRNNLKALRYLALHKDWQFNITELAKDVSLNKGILSRLVEELERENIIKVMRKGKIKLFSINKENLFIKEIIIPLFEKEAEFPYKILEGLVEKVKDKTKSIILYGSFAKGNANLKSDVDLLIITDEKLEKESERFKEEFLKKDLLLRIDLMSEKELKRLYKLKEPFIISVLKNHKRLYGKSLMEMIE